MRETIFSPCRRYRYTLWRDWNPLLTENIYAMFIGLNPSTADETNDDPTIRRCISFSKAWGCDSFCMTNIFAFRATDPKVMIAEPNPIGDENDDWLVRCARKASIIVAAWGVHGEHMGRGKVVARMIPGLKCLGVTKDGYPRHPLYVRGDVVPEKYAGRTLK